MKSELTAPCSKQSLKIIRDFVDIFLRDTEISSTDANLFKVAVDEMCTNLIIHGHNSDSDECLQISLHKNPEVVWCEIIDSSDFFDLLKYQEDSIAKILDKGRKGGMGISLIKKIMDKIEARQENGRNTYVLYKKIPVAI